MKRIWLQIPSQSNISKRKQWSRLNVCNCKFGIAQWHIDCNMQNIPVHYQLNQRNIPPDGSLYKEWRTQLFFGQCFHAITPFRTAFPPPAVDSCRVAANGHIEGASSALYTANTLGFKKHHNRCFTFCSNFALVASMVSSTKTGTKSCSATIRFIQAQYAGRSSGANVRRGLTNIDGHQTSHVQRGSGVDIRKGVFVGRR